MNVTAERRTQILLAALIAAAAALYLFNLSATGYGNLFYAAAAEAGSHSWSAWFFGSLDANNFITVDKPPASLWITGLSVRLFGMNSCSILAPQALMGAASVAVLSATVRRAFAATGAGSVAGLLAGAALACTPGAALIFRFNNPDALLVLVLTVAGYCLIRAVESASWRWLALVGVATGAAFLTKMGEGFLPLPAFAATYLFLAPTTWRRRLLHLLGGTAALIATAGWWVLTVAVIPATARPYVGGSTDNTVLQLAVGYNGMTRILGRNSNHSADLSSPAFGQGWSRLGGGPGLHRLFTSEMANEISWLLPAALVAAAFGAYLLMRGRLRRGEEAALAMFAGWLLASALVFSYMSGMVHPYYTVAMAPAVAGLVGIGTAWAWRERGGWDGRITMAAMILLTAMWSTILLRRNAFGPEWLAWAVAAVAIVATVAVIVIGGHRGLATAVIVGAVAAIGGPTAFSIATAATPHQGSIPTALRKGPGQLGNWGGDEASNPDLASVLADTHTEWSAATNGSQSAAALEVSSGTAVMAIGGWSGDPVPTLQSFIDDVHAGKIAYYVEAGRGGAAELKDRGEVVYGRSRSAAHTREIADWVADHYQGTVIGESTVYRLT
ncbi:ArnT family glycosyltransferase [Mycolicibacterium stellerae]|uniref:ArnT family glycosyltransferase n=1 Tax=Mycolicibacterium stellerae TaxID=2358193 RepID=UPI000F0BCFA3|nr:glycosyltransferase family 39 protein [Mycolicibacterium stellerae]